LFVALDLRQQQQASASVSCCPFHLFSGAFPV
jgi:hypothetical protein